MTTTNIPKRPVYKRSSPTNYVEAEPPTSKLRAEIALLEEYIAAGAASNMLSLCMGVTDNVVCRRTARQGHKTCKDHK